MLQMSSNKYEMRATLLLTLCAVCLLPTSAAGAADASSPHHDDQSEACPSSRVAAECKACSVGASAGDTQVYVGRCCSDVEMYSTCRDELDAKAKSLVKRSLHQFDDIQLLDDDDDGFQEDKRRTPFLGKRKTPFLGKRRVNPFLGKRRIHAPFLGKRIQHDLEDIVAEKRRMPFLG